MTDRGKPVLVAPDSGATDHTDLLGLSRFLESHPGPAVVSDDEGIVRLVNRAACELFLAPPDDLVDQPVEQLVPGHMREAHARHRARFMETPSHRPMGLGRDLVARRRDGTLVPVEVGLGVLTLGGRAYVWAVLTDISLRKAAESELRATSETLSVLIESSPLPVSLVDLDGTVRLWNPAAARTFGYTASEAIGRRLPQVPESGRRQADDVYARVRRGEHVRGLEVVRERADGGLRTCELYASPRREHDGSVTGIVVQLVDVTERRRQEAAMRQAAKMESLGRLAGGVAHDFNNLLTAIRGFAELVAQDLDGPSRSRERENLDSLMHASDRATDLIAQLLAFARPAPLDAAVIDVALALEDTRSLLRRLLPENVELRMALGVDTGAIRMEPSQLSQILLNMAANARDAMPDGGRLLIECEPVAFDEEAARTRPNVGPGRYAMIAITDTGMGMDPDVREHLFEPFFTTKGEGRGTGLGLATAYGIVRAAGGDIWVYSEPGAGTTFKVYVPIVTVAGDDDSTDPGSEPARGAERVLVVEDDESVRTLAQIVLARAGYEVHAAGSPADALELVASRGERPFDLLVSDVMLPGANGAELARMLRATMAEMRVLLLSGYTAEALGRATLGDADAFLAKPFDPDALVRAARDALDAPMVQATAATS